ncbi:hypothetical protein HanXRQr2_Chr07g0306831 [Helianthus annuus]|uniref:Uncharacterized protein n=1 Tax=Helianthus annuus TaxID=4232 RepID=A0A9K3INN9_HELAN|nr:hypothetical protein HanXRQr2_Chr07g0306831 [Helianthus annuus]
MLGFSIVFANAPQNWFMGRTGSDRVEQYQNWFNLMHRFYELVFKRKPYWIVSVSNRIKTPFHPSLHPNRF